jgi:SET domain-containing protein 6
MEVDNFEVKTKVFLSWLSKMGVRMNPKMALVDLRKQGRGRGVGEFLIS